MKTTTAFAALLVLAVAPAGAQQPTREPEKRASEPAEIELLELEQVADKTLLREAMLLVGQRSLKQARDQPVSDADRQRDHEYLVTLKRFIEEKKQAYTERAAVLKNKRAESARPVTTQRSQAVRPVVTPADDKARQGLVEKLEEVQLEVNLLQMRVQLYQQPLNEAVQALANAEFAADNDPSQREKAEAARKRFEEAKSKFLDVSTKLRLEQHRMAELQRTVGGGGFR
jgi:hypothetical protein